MHVCLQVLVWTLAAAPIGRSGAAPASDIDRSIAEATARYEDGDYLRAAELLEDLAARSGQPRFLYNAGLARSAAGHRAHAIAHLATYLERTEADGGTPMRTDARTRLDELRVDVQAIQLQVEPHEVLAELEVTARFLGRDKRRGPRGDARPLLRAPVARHTGLQSIHLDPGHWHVVVESRGFLTQEFAVHIHARGRPPTARRMYLHPDPRYQEVAFHLDVQGETPPSVEVVARGGIDPSRPQTCRADDFEGRTCHLRLLAGTWSILMQADGYTTTERTIVIGEEDSASFTLPLVPLGEVDTTPQPPEKTSSDEGDEDDEEDETGDDDPEPKHLPRQVKRSLTNGLNAAGLPLFVGGLATAIYGTSVYTDRISTPSDTCGGVVACQKNLLVPLRMRPAGVGLIGSGVGVLLTALTAELDAPATAWVAEASVGGALTLGGAAWLIANTLHINRHLTIPGFGDPDWETELDRNNTHRLVAAGMTGLGVGMVVGATIGGLVYRKYQRKRSLRVDPVVGQNVGLVLGGRF